MKSPSQMKPVHPSQRVAGGVILAFVFITAVVVGIVWWGSNQAPVVVTPTVSQNPATTVTPAVSSTSDVFSTSTQRVIDPDLQDVLPATSTGFAAYVDEPVSVSPKVPTYRVASNLSNVARAKDMPLTPAQTALVVKNGFVVVPKGPEGGYEFYPAYEEDRYAQIPFFVTTDSLAHSYHLIFDLVLKHLEEQKLSHSLVTLTDEMYAASLAQYASVKGTAWEEAARRNVGFFAVPKALNDPTFQPPAFVLSNVRAELAQIASHQGRQPSALFPKLLEDYSQYVPRGHYTENEQLQTYFQMMMWYGRIGLDVTDATNVRSAALMTLALRDPNIRARWSQISDPIGFLVGKSDDATWADFEKVMFASYGTETTPSSILSDVAGFTALTSAVKSLPAPQINSGHITATTVNRGTEFRFMGQRFTMDANIFQQLIDTDLPKRQLPRALDICAAYGSDEAFNLVTASEPQYQKDYATQMSKVRAEVARQTLGNKTSTLYGSWLYALQPLVEPATTGTPAFMQNVAWTRKQLMTYLGSYTELKHDTILYAKQAYAAEMGGGGDVLQKDDRGYVEPQPLVFARFAALADMTLTGLSSRGMLDETSKDDLTRLAQLSRELKTISIKELENMTLTNDEYDFIRAYGGNLEHMWADAQDSDTETTLDTPSAIIADVATSPSTGNVQEEATGLVASIYVIVPIDGKPHLTRGAVFTQYEFQQDMSDRLTDAAWRDLLLTQKAPPLAAWTHAFISP